MSTSKTITRVKDLPKSLDMMEYMIVIRKNGRFVKAVLFQGYSGSAMMDIVPDYRKAFPKEEGYVVEW